jgi:hypothetical protein
LKVSLKVLLFGKHKFYKDDYYDIGYPSNMQLLFQVFIELISGWVLGKGPCGPACSKADIGRSTRITRSSMMSSDPYYFGHFTLEYKNKDKTYITTDIYTRVNKTFIETVIDVDEHTKWEQEIMHFSFIKEKVLPEITIRFYDKLYKLVHEIEITNKN